MPETRTPSAAAIARGKGRRAAAPQPSTLREDRGGFVSGARREAVLAKAATIFAEKGFAGTTLRDIADALEISRPSIYYYFSNKEELLDELVRNVSVEAVTTVPFPEAADAEGHRQALRSAVRAVYLYVAARPEMFRMLTSSELQLPKATSRRFQMAKGNFVDRVKRLIEAGIAAGVFRNIDAGVASLAIMSMATMRALSYPDTRAITDLAAADLIADMAVRAIEVGLECAVVNVGQVFERLREDLSLAERMVREP